MWLPSRLLVDGGCFISNSDFLFTVLLKPSLHLADLSLLIYDDVFGQLLRVGVLDALQRDFSVHLQTC